MNFGSITEHSIPKAYYAYYSILINIVEIMAWEVRITCSKNNGMYIVSNNYGNEERLVK